MSDFEEDLLNDLEEDLGTDSNDSDVEETDVDGRGTSEPLNRDNFVEFLIGLKKSSGKVPFSSIDVETVDPKVISPISAEHEFILNKIVELDVNFIDVLSPLIDLLPVIKEDIDNLFRMLCILYHEKFSELQSLATDPQEYCRIVNVLESEDLKLDNVANVLETDAHISKSKILILTVSMKTSFHPEVEVPQVKISAMMELINNLVTVQQEIKKFIGHNSDIVAPNLTALVGSEIAALLLAHSGSVSELSLVPSCNLASIGKNKYQSYETNTNISGVRQEGYLYNSDLVLEQDIAQRKKMLRMLCAKVSLAARVDSGQQNSNPKDNTMGIKWREELLLKIKKISEPPNVTDQKILPIPEDKPKKKRAGRKFRKYKEQFKLSHLRQLQNRVEFGKQEQTVMDAFGEEIGMGMVHTSLQKLSQVNSEIDRNVNNRAKLSKNMRARLKEFDSNRTDKFHS